MSFARCWRYSDIQRCLRASKEPRAEIKIASNLRPFMYKQGQMIRHKTGRSVQARGIPNNGQSSNPTKCPPTHPWKTTSLERYPGSIVVRQPNPNHTLSEECLSLDNYKNEWSWDLIPSTISFKGLDFCARAN